MAREHDGGARRLHDVAPVQHYEAPEYYADGRPVLASDQRVLRVVWRLMGRREGGWSKAGQRYIAAEVGVTDRALRDCFARLRAGGLLRVENNGTFGKLNRYQVLPPPRPVPQFRPWKRSSAPPGSRRPPRGGSGVPPKSLSYEREGRRPAGDAGPLYTFRADPVDWSGPYPLLPRWQDRLVAAFADERFRHVVWGGRRRMVHSVEANPVGVYLRLVNERSPDAPTQDVGITMANLGQFTPLP